MSENILHAPAMFRDMVTTAEPELASVLSDDSAAADIARRIATKFCEMHGGKTYRVPELCRAQIVERNAKIRQEIKSMSIQKVARIHGVSVKHVRRILREDY